MSHYGPFQTRVGLYQRFTNFFDLMVRNTPDVSAYRLWGAATLNDAYGNLVGSGVGGTGPNEILVARLNSIAQTPGAAAAGCSKVPENRKGQTSFQVDPRNIPVMDEQFLFVRVQEYRHSTNTWLTVQGPVNNGVPICGPILITPPVSFFQSQSGAYTVSGIAPSGTGCTVGAIPVIDVTVQTPLPMHIVFPRPVASLLIKNEDDTNNLLISYGVGSAMVSVAQGESLVPNYGHGTNAITEILIASEQAGGCAFSLDVMTEHGGC